MGTRPRQIRRLLVAGSLTAAGLLETLTGSGCAGAGQRWKKTPNPPLQSAMAPPTMEGSAVRSQDASKLTKVLSGKKNTLPAPPATDRSPKVAWSSPPDAKPAQPPTLAPIPSPPELPSLKVQAPPLTVASLEPARRAVPAPAAAEPPPTESSPTAASPAAPADQLQALVREARSRLARVSSYQTHLRRQERVGNNLQPAEDVVLSIRREPVAVRLEWPEGPNKGREVIFSPVETAGKMQIYQPGSLMPRVTLSPDSPLVLRNSRHPITEAGFDVLLGNLEKTAQRQAGHDPAIVSLACQGPVALPGSDRPCHQITEVRADGETWTVYLDAESLLPVTVRGTAQDGALLELYTFSDTVMNVDELATDTAFSPEARWGKGGLLSRMARGGTDTPANAAPLPR